MLARDRELVEGVREREVGKTLVDGGARLDVVGPHRVADHDEIGPRAEDVLGAEALVRRGCPIASSAVLIGG